MDIGSAFTFAFDDENWIVKLIIGGAVVLGAILLSPILIGLALFLPLAGYMLQVLQNVRDGQPVPLPEWSDFGGLFSKGLMVFVVGLVYAIPVLLFACASIGLGIVTSLPEVNSDLAGALGIASICLSCLQILFGLALAILLPGAFIFYAENEQFGDAFKFGEIFNFITSNLGDYIIVVLLGIVAQFIAQFGVILCLVGIFVTSFWATLVQANLYGQLARKRTGMVDVSVSPAGT
jgi:hypothetical protein